MTPIRLLIADVDGTVVTREKVVTPRALQAVEKMRAAGILFSITTGRPPRGVLKLAKDLGLTTPIAAFNGGALVRPDLEVIVERKIPLAAAAEVVHYLEKAGVEPWVYTGVDWYSRKAEMPHIEREKRNVGFEPTIVQELRPVLDGAIKIVGVCDDAQLLASCEAELRRRLGADVTAVRSQPYYLDVTHADANKGMVAHLNSQFFRIPLDEIAAIGDMLNDVLMFGVVGHSIAMGNANPEVQRAARYVTTSNENEGFANAVDWYVLRESHPLAQPTLGLPARVRACLFDLDGVLTKTTKGRVTTYDDSVRFVREVRKAGLRTAVVSPSKKVNEVLTTAGISDLFDARIDGVVAAKGHLARQPAPDTLLAAARELGVAPADAAVFEGAPSGVEAGRAGHFCYVVGVDRDGQAAALRSHGADGVVSDLSTLLEPQ